MAKWALERKSGLFSDMEALCLPGGHGHWGWDWVRGWDWDWNWHSGKHHRTFSEP